MTAWTLIDPVVGEVLHRDGREIKRDVGDRGRRRRRRGRSIGRSRQTSPVSTALDTQGIAARGIVASRVYTVDARTIGRGAVSSSRTVPVEGREPRERAVTCHSLLDADDGTTRDALRQGCQNIGRFPLQSCRQDLQLLNSLGQVPGFWYLFPEERKTDSCLSRPTITTSLDNALKITKHPQDYMYTVPELFEATFPSTLTCASTTSRSIERGSSRSRLRFSRGYGNAMADLSHKDDGDGRAYPQHGNCIDGVSSLRFLDNQPQRRHNTIRNK
ncbi:hypothetical protein EAG_07303 [Camponotus floridanus]|uniref:Uncharacterized protein n=1 Tax=Camponotus floridanus TaxID=104421 RepID=E2AFB2_CAMFO|nr:hypothetical protein EAG_07303 [Camponotus floridanus]